VKATLDNVTFPSQDQVLGVGSYILSIFFGIGFYILSILMLLIFGNVPSLLVGFDLILRIFFVDFTLGNACACTKTLPETGPCFTIASHGPYSNNTMPWSSRVTLHIISQWFKMSPPSSNKRNAHFGKISLVFGLM
jgi:hypothetical protein